MNKLNYRYTGKDQYHYYFESSNSNYLIQPYVNKPIERNVLFHGDIEGNKNIYYFCVTKSGHITINRKSEAYPANITKIYKSVLNELPIPKYVQQILLFLHDCVMNDSNYFNTVEINQTLPINEWLNNKDKKKSKEDDEGRLALLKILINNDLK